MRGKIIIIHYSSDINLSEVVVNIFARKNPRRLNMLDMIF